MNLLNKIINFWKPEELEELQTPQDGQSGFVLCYKGLEVGTLILKEGQWTFAYSEDFKHQSHLMPLVDFPNIDRKYSSKSLWPFFASRIPSTKLPTVQDIIRKRNINARDEVQMLTEFGRRTITNPFLLTPIHELVH